MMLLAGELVHVGTRPNMNHHVVTCIVSISLLCQTSATQRPEECKQVCQYRAFTSLHVAIVVGLRLTYKI